MHIYPADSPAAISRLLALAMIVDGDISPSEMRAMHKAEFLRQVKVDADTFDHTLRELCEDLLGTAANRGAGIADIDPVMLDGLLREVHDPLLQICLFKTMADIVHADDRVDGRELSLVRRAARFWFGGEHANRSAAAERAAK